MWESGSGPDAVDSIRTVGIAGIPVALESLVWAFAARAVCSVAEYAAQRLLPIAQV